MTATPVKHKKEDKKAPAKKAVQTKKSPKNKSWNTMSHLLLKRFADDDATLTAGAKRDRQKHPHIAIAELDPSGRAKCKLCGDKLNKSSVRFGLFLECHKGYRNLCTLHPECFWKHPETQKLEDTKELYLSPKLTQEQSSNILQQFAERKK